MHHQGGVNFENFTEVKFRDIFRTETGHRDRRLNRGCPGQTGTYGRFNLLTSGSFVKDHLLFLLFTISTPPGHFPPTPLVGAQVVYRLSVLYWHLSINVSPKGNKAVLLN